MILDQWMLSLIIGGIILLIVVPLLFWIRYGKNGKRLFAKNNILKTKNTITQLEEKIQKEQIIITNLKNKNVEYSQIKKRKKELIRLERELKNKKAKK